MTKTSFILSHHLAPGDVVVASALARDLKRAMGDDVDVAFHTNRTEVFMNNPYLTTIEPGTPNVIEVSLDYSPYFYRHGGKKKHFLTAFHQNFYDATRIEIPVTESKPDLHLSKYEKETPPITGRYWVVFAGGKTDMYTKHWDTAWYQEVVNRLRLYGLRFVQSGAVGPDHIHRPLKNTLNLVGWGGLREMFWQIYHAEGVICPITCAMHVCAAFDKPCVVIAGGREEPWWEGYVNDYGAFGESAAPVTVPHRYLHTVGLLDCCKQKGCWNTKLVVREKEDEKKLCTTLADRRFGQQAIPKCMDMIQPDHVIEAVMSYYLDGTLPPIGEPKGRENA